MNEDQIKALFAKFLADAGVLTKNEFNSTAAMIRGLKDAVDGMKSSNPMDTLVSLGLLEKGEDGSYQPKSNAAPAPQNKQEQDPEWKLAIENLKKSLKAKDDELATERQRAADVEKRNAILAALSSAGAVNPGRDVVHMLERVQRNENGQYVSRGKDDLGLDIETPLEDVVTKFLASNPELKKATAHAGSGTPAAIGGAGDLNLSNMPMDQYMANRKKFLEGGDVKVTF